MAIGLSGFVASAILYTTAAAKVVPEESANFGFILSRLSLDPRRCLLTERFARAQWQDYVVHFLSNCI